MQNDVCLISVNDNFKILLYNHHYVLTNNLELQRNVLSNLLRQSYNLLQTYYQKGDYVLVQGRLKISKKQNSKLTQRELPLRSTKEYHLNVFKMSLICRP